MSKENNQEIQKMVTEQGGVEHQRRKEVNVEDYTKVASIARTLKDMEFPVDKSKIIQYVQ